MFLSTTHFEEFQDDIQFNVHAIQTALFFFRRSMQKQRQAELYQALGCAQNNIIHFYSLRTKKKHTIKNGEKALLLFWCASYGKSRRFLLFCLLRHLCVWMSSQKGCRPAVPGFVRAHLLLDSLSGYGRRYRSLISNQSPLIMPSYRPLFLTYKLSALCWYITSVWTFSGSPINQYIYISYSFMIQWPLSG